MKIKIKQKLTKKWFVTLQNTICKMIEQLEKDFGSDPSKLIEDIGKNVRTMPQIKIENFRETKNLSPYQSHLVILEIKIFMKFFRLNLATAASS